MPALLDDFYPPYKVEKDAGQKVIFSKACTDAAKFPKRLGRAGFYFRPSNVAGDDYRIRAEIDFTGLPNQAQLESFNGVRDQASRIHAESGTLRVWRTAQIALEVHWPARTNDHEWAAIATEFGKAYLDVDVGHITAKNMADVITEDQYKTIVADHTSHKKRDVHLLPDAMVGVEVPKQGSMNAAAYRTALKTFVNDNYAAKIRYALREQLSANIRKDYPSGFVLVEFRSHHPVRVLKAPPADNTVVNASYVAGISSVGLPDSVAYINQEDRDKVYYVVSPEMGHCFWLHHWEHAPGSTADDHDQQDHNCTMSYPAAACPHPNHRTGVYTPHFCGKCNLRLRGWNIAHVDSPDESS